MADFNQLFEQLSKNPMFLTGMYGLAATPGSRGIQPVAQGFGQAYQHLARLNELDTNKKKSELYEQQVNLQIEQAREQKKRQKAMEEFTQEVAGRMDPNLGPAQNLGPTQIAQMALSRGVIDPLEYAKGLGGEQEYTLSPGQVRYRGGQKIAEGAPKPEDVPSSIKEINYLIDKVQNSSGATRKFYQDRLTKLTSRADSQVTVSLGAPQIFQDEEGNFKMIQPANRQGVPPQVTDLPEGFKPSSKADVPLPSTAVKELSGAGAATEQLTDLTGKFKPEYGGKKILGDLQNKYLRIMGDETGQAQWWQQMDQLQNQTRHELFGSALTKTEMNAWEKTSVTPNMDPDQIKFNLANRKKIEERAAKKLAKSYKAAGYNKKQILELLGKSADYLEDGKPVTTLPGGWTVKVR